MLYRFSSAQVTFASLATVIIEKVLPMWIEAVGRVKLFGATMAKKPAVCLSSGISTLLLASANRTSSAVAMYIRVLDCLAVVFPTACSLLVNLAGYISFLNNALLVRLSEPSSQRKALTRALPITREAHDCTSARQKYEPQCEGTRSGRDYIQAIDMIKTVFENITNTVSEERARYRK